MIFLPGNVPSSKNGKQVIKARGRTMVVWSKVASRYRKNIKPELTDKKETFHELTKKKDPPYHCAFHFVRDSKRKFDFHNAVQTISDLMVSNDWMDDDNMDCFIPHPLERDGQWYSVNKDKPGVYIEVL